MVISDYNPEIIQNLRYAIRLNRIPECNVSLIDRACAAATNNVSAETLDWDLTPDQPQCQHDIIIGADIVCQRSDCDGIARVLKTRLRAGGFAAFVCSSEKNRFGVEALQGVLEDGGFSVNVSSVDQLITSKILRQNRTQNSRPSDELQLYQISHDPDRE